MFSFLFKHLIIRQHNVLRSQSRKLSTVKDAAKPDIRDTGIVKRFSQNKGYGFIKRHSDGNDIFVHFQSIVGSGFKTLEVNKQIKKKHFFNARIRILS